MSAVPTLVRSRPSRLRGLWSEEGLAPATAMIAELCGDDPLGSVLWEHVSTGGKRLRARLALGSLEALGGHRLDGIAWAAACELLHNATLVHDDVQDGDRLRRGRETVWVRHGVNQAINAGDLGLMLPCRAVEYVPVDAATRWDLARTLARLSEEVVRGQAAETLLLQRTPTWRDYHASVEGKTAALFVLPVYGAARIAGLGDEAAMQIADAFRAVGVLFQVQDDVLDLFGDKGRGEVGSDLREGKASALVVEHLRLNPDDADWLVRLLMAPRERTSGGDVRWAIRRFQEGGALQAVWSRIGTIEEDLAMHPALEPYPRLQALALDLVGLALAPIAHTAILGANQ